jgi:NinB protein
MSGYRFRLGQYRETVHRAIAAAPDGSRVSLEPPRRTDSQNDKMWALLGELAMAKPQGRSHPPHVWKALVMDLADKKPIWEPSLDGQGVVCVGYKSSRLSKAEMSDVIEAVYSYGAENGVTFSQ